MPDVISWEGSLRFVRFFLLDLIEERPGLCREGGWGRGQAGLYLGVSFHKRFATLCWNWNPVGTSRFGVIIYAGHGRWTEETNCTKAQWICQINAKRGHSKATSLKLAIDVMYFDKHKVIYDCSHSCLTISHMIHQHYTCCSEQFQLLEKRGRTSDVLQWLQSLFWNSGCLT